MFTPRLTKPEAGNKYYIRKAQGGYSNAILGNSALRDKDCNTLPNCVGYAYGRFNEIGGYGTCKFLKPVNAALFINYMDKELKVSQTPSLGAVMVWAGGASGCGHVAIVEKIITADEVLTSESGWSLKSIFRNVDRKKENNWGMGAKYPFLGFIKNPAVKDDTKGVDDISISFNGEMVECQGFNIDGTNYIRLRDLEDVMKLGRVYWDGEKPCVETI